MSERAWILLPSGNQLNLLDPDPWAWTDDDLAIGLSRTYRWAGYSAWDLPLSVAQHSLAVLALRRSLFADRPLPVAHARRELLHDATEALIGGWDPITPLKPHLGPGFSTRSPGCRQPSTSVTTYRHGCRQITPCTSEPIGSPLPTRPITWLAGRAPQCASNSGSKWLRSRTIRSICRRISGHGSRGRPSWPTRASFANCGRLLPTKAPVPMLGRERGTDTDLISALIGLTESGRSLKG